MSAHTLDSAASPTHSAKVHGGATPRTSAEIARRLGGDDVVSADGWCRAPCPAHHGTAANLSLRLHGPGRLVVRCWSHGCPADEILQAIDARLGTRFGRTDAAADFTDTTPILGPQNGAETGPGSAAFALWLAEEAGLNAMLRTVSARVGAERCFQTARPLQRGDLVDQYLRGRGIALEQFPAALRLHPGLYHRESQKIWPCLVAKIVAGAGRFLTVQRTFLDPQTAGKAPVDPPRKLFSSMRGGAVRLFDPGGDQLLISRGCRDACSAGLMLSSWSLAGWAAISTSGLVGRSRARPLSPVVVAADNDASGAGLRAARALAKRLRATGCRVDIRMPPRIGSDWNDMLTEQMKQGEPA